MGLAELFDISLDRANDFYTWGWRLSVFGAALTMIGVAALWIGTRVRDRDFEIQMTTVNLASSQALERAGTLERDAATIRERAANAELRLEQLRKDLGPRHLQRDIFLKELFGQPSAQVEILYLQDDPECFGLAQEIWRALEDAKWPVMAPKPIPSLFLSDGPTSLSVGAQPSGVTIVARQVTLEEADASQNAFLGKEWIKSPWTVLKSALAASLGKISASAGTPNGPPEGTLRVVVTPRG
ncbi:MAG TPA: hypothetical protein VHQ48_15555 [Bradyrhizobium sp.]|jgi:hypothetical protein|nr:hypothetical protein [Bradyrhizobium sp.]